MITHRHPNTRFRLVTCVSVTLLASGAGLTMASASGGSGPSPALAAPAADIGYAINQPLCQTVVRPGHVTCFALKRVPVKKGTPGARPYLKHFGFAARPAVTSDAIGPGPAGGYTPDDLAAAYNYDPTTSRAGQIVGIVDWFNDPRIKANLATFDSHYKLPAETSRSFRLVNEDGAATPLPSSTKGKDSAGEIALDVETVRAVCNTCRILLVEATNSSDANLAAAENTAVRLGATEVTNSFGGPEGGPPSSYTSAFNHRGVVITASTGDDGWYGWDFADNPKIQASEDSSEFPASDPNVVSVGGTSLLISKSGTIADQTVWNDDGTDDLAALNANQSLGAGGGGCSVEFTAASWQSSFPGYSAAGCGGNRLAADVSATADPEFGFDTYDTWGSGDNGWSTIGGTSLASPLIAAMFALAGGSGGAAYPALSMYHNATTSPSLVYDVTSGGNSFCGGDTTLSCGTFVQTGFGTSNPNPNALGAGPVDCSFPLNGAAPATTPPESSECNATIGFDGPTGIGAPLGAGLFASTSPAVSLTPPAVVRLDKVALFTAHATERLSTAHITAVSFAWGDGHTTTGIGTDPHPHLHEGGRPHDRPHRDRQHRPAQRRAHDDHGREGHLPQAVRPDARHTRSEGHLPGAGHRPQHRRQGVQDRLALGRPRHQQGRDGLAPLAQVRDLPDHHHAGRQHRRHHHIRRQDQDPLTANSRCRLDRHRSDTGGAVEGWWVLLSPDQPYDLRLVRFTSASTWRRGLPRLHDPRGEDEDRAHQHKPEERRADLRDVHADRQRQQDDAAEQTDEEGDARSQPARMKRITLHAANRTSQCRPRGPDSPRRIGCLSRSSACTCCSARTAPRRGSPPPRSATRSGSRSKARPIATKSKPSAIAARAVSSRLTPPR